MAVQLMLRDAGRLCFPIHVSPSYGYTVAFKLQQRTSDWDGEAKLEACNMFATPTWRMSTAAGLWGGRAQHINIYLSYLRQETGPPKGTRCVCELSEPGAWRNIFPLQSLDGGWITNRGRQESLWTKKKTRVWDTLEHPQPTALGAKNSFFQPWAT